MTRDKVFISYSHKDKKFLESLQIMLTPLIRKGGLLVWDDDRIKAGDFWRKEIDAALSEACVAVMLVSPNFLASKFISDVELPALLGAAESNQLKVCWVLLSACLYGEYPNLTMIQAAHDISHPLDTLPKAKQNSVLVEIARTINEQYKAMTESKQEAPVAEKAALPVEKDLSSLPHVFLSYHSGDAKKAQQVRDALQSAGIPVWRDQDSIQIGAQFSIEIEQALRRSAMMISLVTQGATESTWVRNEILFAMEHKKSIVPLLMEPGVKLPIEIIGTQSVNMTENWDEGMQRLIERVRFILQNVKVEKEPSKSALEPAVVQPAQGSQNPFIFGNAVPAELFVERKATLDVIGARVGNYYSLQSISIVANRRMGKTSLLNYIWKKPQLVFASDYSYATIYVDAMDARTHSIQGFMRILRKSLENQLGKTPWAESDDGNLTVFSEAIEEIAEKGEKRVVLLLDEFESIMAYQELDILLDTLRACGSQSRIGMIVSTAHELSELEAEGKLASPFDNIFQTCYLGSFTESECDNLVRRAFERSGMTISDDDLNVVRDLSGRHPYLVQLAGSLVWKARKNQLGLQTIPGQFKQNARDIFGGILQRLTPAQLDIVRQLSGLQTRQDMPESVLAGLQARGIVDGTNSLFSGCFAEYVREELR